MSVHASDPAILSLAPPVNVESASVTPAQTIAANDGDKRSLSERSLTTSAQEATESQGLVDEKPALLESGPASDARPATRIVADEESQPASFATANATSSNREDEQPSKAAIVVDGEEGQAAQAKKEEEQEEEEDESKYPSGFAITILTIGLLLATFVVALDNTIIATAIPRITEVFDSLGDVGWYGSSYLLTQTSLQPTFGKVYTYFNVKWTFIFALFIFEVGSVVCAAAQSSVMLIIGRALAGAGASAIFSGGMTIIAYSVPLRKRAGYMGLVSSMFGIASVVGPLLGGAFTDHLTWRWCFWINLPFGGLSIATVFIFFKNPKRDHADKTLKEKIAEMDLLGAFFLICAIVCLLLALQWGGSKYAWSDSKVWGNLLGFGLIIAVFIGIQFRKGDQATIPPRIMKQRTIAAGCTFMFLFAMALYAHIYYLPFYFQAVLGTTAEGSGIRTIPFLVTVTLGSVFTGLSITVLGWYVPFMWVGCAMYVVGAGLLYTLQIDTSTGRWIGYQIVAGMGAGICIQVPFFSSQVVLSGKDMPTGNALTIFSNSLGGALSVSIAQTIFSNTLLKQLRLDPQLSLPHIAKIIGAGATGIRAVTPPSELMPVLQAYDTAVTRAFVLSIAAGGLSFIASLFMEWKTVKGKKLAMAGGA